MKIWHLSLVLFAFACGNSSSSNNSFGTAVDTSAAVSFDQGLANFTQNGTANATVKGAIGTVCQGEGCWFSFSNYPEIIVDFGEKFTIPKNVSGKNAIATGQFYTDTTSILQLQNAAKEQGKPQTEIESITEPEINIKFSAQGLIIQ